MTIRHLRIFVRVYQLQSITQAAEALHLTQPAVSRSRSWRAAAACAFLSA